MLFNYINLIHNAVWAITAVYLFLVFITLPKLCETIKLFRAQVLLLSANFLFVLLVSILQGLFLFFLMSVYSYGTVLFLSCSNITYLPGIAQRREINFEGKGDMLMRFVVSTIGIAWSFSLMSTLVGYIVIHYNI